MGLINEYTNTLPLVYTRPIIGDNHFTFVLNISAFQEKHEYNTYNLFALIENQKESSFMLNITIPTFSNAETPESRNSFFGTLILKSKLSKYDQSMINFGDFLHSSFKFNTRNRKLINTQFEVDETRSLNFSFVNSEKSRMELYLDFSGIHLMYIILDTNLMRAQVTIPKEKAKECINVLFDDMIPTKVDLNDFKRGLVSKEFKISGFDISGEPRVKFYDSNLIEIIFNFMPPLNGADNQSSNEVFQNFEVFLSAKLGVEVLRDDKEVFLIKNGDIKILENLHSLLSNFWGKRKGEKRLGFFEKILNEIIDEVNYLFK